MLIYAGTKSDFMIDAENDCLETMGKTKCYRWSGCNR